MLFTALHHSREVTTLTMILKILLTKLHELVFRNATVSFFDLADILFVPFVNRDGYDFITNSFETQNWPFDNFQRKNLNKTIRCE